MTVQSEFQVILAYLFEGDTYETTQLVYADSEQDAIDRATADLQTTEHRGATVLGVLINGREPALEPPAPIDITVENHGSIVLVRPETVAGEEWIAQHCDPEAAWWGNAMVVEPRYVGPILEGAARDGLVIA